MNLLEQPLIRRHALTSRAHFVDVSLDSTATNRIANHWRHLLAGMFGHTDQGADLLALYAEQDHPASAR